VVRAADTVQYGAALARSQAELPVAAAQAARWGNWRARASSPRPRRRGPRSPAGNAGDHGRKPPPAGAGRRGRDGTITLRAPIAGRVSTVSVDTGAAVGNGAAPFVVENASALRLDLQIPERLAGRCPGMAVHVEQDGRSAKGACFPWRDAGPGHAALAAKASLMRAANWCPARA
jgi:cobalt-zinc-cadmium efflux system membrane fusion protein